MKVYFAHNMSDYGTAKEKRELRQLSDFFPEILNPADCEAEYQATSPNDKSFSFWYSKLEKCDALVYTTTTEKGINYIGRGVLAEITHAFKKEMTVYQLIHNGSLMKRSPKLTGTINFNSGCYYFEPMGL